MSPIASFKSKLFEVSFFGLVAGILVGQYFQSRPLSYLFLLISVLLLVYSLIKQSRNRVLLFLLPFFFLFLFIGNARTISKPPPVLQTGREVTIEGSVKSFPQEGADYTSFVFQSGDVKFLARIEPVEIEYGDTLKLSGRIESPASFKTENGRLFDYPGYLRKDGIAYILNFGKVNERNVGPLSLKKMLYRVKSRSLQKIDELFYEPRSSLLSGILLGNKGLKNYDQVFRRTGLSHITVLSGYNIAVVIVLVGVLLRKVRLKLRILGIFLSVSLFTLMVSNGASTVRAAFMAFAVLLSKLLHRKVSAWRALFVAVFFMLILNPLILFYDPGFALSFLATAGLIAFGSWFSGKLNFVTEKFGLKEVLSTTLSAQLSVLPMLLYVTGYFSVISLPANIIVLPLVAPAMFLGAFAIAVSYLPLPFQPLFSLPADLILGLILRSVRLFGSLPYATVPIPNLSFFQVLLFYLSVGTFLYWRYKKRTRERFRVLFPELRFNRELYSQSRLPRSAN